jgi:hypothetical protein
MAERSVEKDVQLRRSGMNRVVCRELSDVSADIAIAIFRFEYVTVGRFSKSYVVQAVGEFDLMLLIGGVKVRAAIQWQMSTWLTKKR